MKQLDCVINYFFQLYLMLHASVRKFNVMGIVGIFFKTKQDILKIEPVQSAL